MPLRSTLVLVGMCLVVMMAGCSRGDPHLQPIDAHSDSAFAMWRMNAADHFTTDEWREFDAALQELRLEIMGGRDASGREAIEELLRARVNGHSYRDILVRAYRAKLQRLRPTRQALKSAVDGNALLVTKPGDTDSAKHLEELGARQQERLAKLDAEIDATEQRLIALGALSAAELAEQNATRSREVAPAALSREEALAQIKSMMEEHRAVMLMKFAPWPVKIDHDGATLAGAARDEFREHRAAAATNGHVVIAVRLRSRWWIYDAPPEMPTFSRAAMTNLTEDDRREIMTKWLDLQAELWARQQAKEQG
jgi:hypothetical protein